MLYIGRNSSPSFMFYDLTVLLTKTPFKECVRPYYQEIKPFSKPSLKIQQKINEKTE